MTTKPINILLLTTISVSSHAEDNTSVSEYVTAAIDGHGKIVRLPNTAEKVRKMTLGERPRG